MAAILEKISPSQKWVPELDTRKPFYEENGRIRFGTLYAASILTAISLTYTLYLTMRVCLTAAGGGSGGCSESARYAYAMCIQIFVKKKKNVYIE